MIRTYISIYQADVAGVCNPLLIDKTMRKIIEWSAPIMLLAGANNTSYGRGIVVTVEPHDYEVRQDYTRRELNSLRGSSTLAFTAANFGLELFYRLEQGSQPGHIIATLQAKLTGGHQQVQIPLEFAIDSCEYRVLRDHELQHVERNVEAIAWLKQEIEKQESSKPVREFVGKTRDQVIDILQIELDSTRTKVYMKRFSKVRSQLNEPLDFERVRVEQYAQCHNWRVN